MSDSEQLQAWFTVMEPAFIALAVITVVGIVAVVVSDIHEKHTKP